MRFTSRCGDGGLNRFAKIIETHAKASHDHRHRLGHPHMSWVSILNTLQKRINAETSANLPLQGEATMRRLVRPDTNRRVDMLGDSGHRDWFTQ